MSTEALYSVDRRCIFRETFNSEQDALKNNALLSDNYSFVDSSFYGETTGGIYKNNFISLYNRTEFTLRLRLRINDNSIDVTRLFAGNGSNANNTTRIAIANHSTSLYCFISDGVSNCYTAHNISPYLDYEYHDYIMVFDGNLTGNYNRAKMYVDGLLVTPVSASGTIPSSTPDSNLNFRLESYSVNTGLKDKNVDLLEVYDVALSTEEVFNLHNNLTYKDVRKGLIMDINALNGIVQDDFGHPFNLGNSQVQRDTVNSINPNNSRLRYIYAITSINQKSFSLWVKPIVNNNSQQYLFATSGSPGGFDIYINNPAGTIWDNFGATVYVNGKISSTINFSKWNHIVFANIANTNTVSELYYFYKYPNTQMDGLGNELRIYGTLTANEVTQIYTSNKHKYE